MRALLKVVLFVFLGVLFGVSVSRADIVKKCDSFILLVDASSSMNSQADEGSKMDTAKNILLEMNKLIPKADYRCALLAFSYDKERENSFSSKLFYPMSTYDKDKLANAIEELEATRCWTAVGYGLEKAGQLLEGEKGKLVIVLVSDGQDDSDYPKTPVEVASELKKTYGDRLCIYAIQVGESDEGRATLESVVKEIGCGEVLSASDLADESAMADFVKEVFGYTFERDSDGDGVVDSKDKCPNTPKGAKVNAMGCWKPGVVYFEFDSAEVSPEYEPVLDEILVVLKKNPDLKLKVLGYTDSKGSEEYNLKLSQMRAENVKRWFVDHGICPCRVTAVGLGEKYPAATNDTEEGRAKNRRVEFVIVR